MGRGGWRGGEGGGGCTFGYTHWVWQKGLASVVGIAWM